MKLYKIIIVIFISTLLVFIYYRYFDKSTLSKNKGQQKYEAPHIFSNAGHGIDSNKIESNSQQQALQPTNDKLTAKSQKNLAGTITNQYGIRDDILEYIIDNIPPGNKLAMEAAIKFAAYNQRIYYGNLTQEEALKLANKEMLVRSCLYDYLPNNVGLKFTRACHQSV